MKNYYYALRCFLLDFWQHSLGECAPSSNPALHKAIYQAADTNITSLLGSNVITDVPRCLHLVGSGRVCWVHCVRGEEFAAADPQVRLGDVMTWVDLDYNHSLHNVQRSKLCCSYGARCCMHRTVTA
jgi:hypothetical protein